MEGVFSITWMFSNKKNKIKGEIRTGYGKSKQKMLCRNIIIKEIKEK